jgi:hypothetical protein
MPVDKLTIDQFADKIKAKYPEYKDTDNALLTQKIVAKYPQYKDMVHLDNPDATLKLSDTKTNGVQNTTTFNPNLATKPVSTEEKVNAQYTPNLVQAGKEKKEKDITDAATNTAMIWAKNNPVLSVFLNKTNNEGYNETKLQKLKTNPLFRQKVSEIAQGINSGKYATYTEQDGKLYADYEKTGLKNLFSTFGTAWSAGGDAKKINQMSDDDFIKYANEKKQAAPTYLPTKENTESFSGSVGGALPTILKGGAGYLAGKAMDYFAPGSGEVMSPVIASWIATVPEMSDIAKASNRVQWYYRAKEENPNISDKEAVAKADHMATVGAGEAMLEGTALNAMGFGGRLLPEATGEGFLNATKQWLAKTAINATATGALSGTGAIAKDLIAKYGLGYNVGQGEMTSNFDDAMNQMFTTQMAFDVVHGLIGAPKYVKSQAKEVLTKVDPQVLTQLQQDAVNNGTLSQDQVSDVSKDLKGYNEASKKIIPTGDEEKDAVIKGLIQKKNNLQEQKKQLDETQHPQIDEQIKAINAKVSQAMQSENPLSFEQDDLTGEHNANPKEFDELKKKEQQGVVVPKDYGEATVKEVGEGENKKYIPQASFINKQGVIEISEPIKIEDAKEYTDKDKAQQAADNALARHYYDNGLHPIEKPQKERQAEVIQQRTDESVNSGNELISSKEGQPNEATVNKVEQGTQEEKSLKQKVGEMNGLGLKLANEIDNKSIDGNKLTDDEINILYGVADGLTEDFVNRHIEGRVSLASMDKWTPEKLEQLVDEKIKTLNDIKNKHLSLEQPTPITETEPTKSSGKDNSVVDVDREKALVEMKNIAKNEVETQDEYRKRKGNLLDAIISGKIDGSKYNVSEETIQKLKGTTTEKQKDNSVATTQTKTTEPTKVGEGTQEVKEHAQNIEGDKGNSDVGLGKEAEDVLKWSWGGVGKNAIHKLGDELQGDLGEASHKFSSALSHFYMDGFNSPKTKAALDEARKNLIPLLEKAREIRQAEKPRLLSEKEQPTQTKNTEEEKQIISKPINQTENALQEPSPSGILQHTQSTVGETGSERRGMESGIEGNETTRTQEKGKSTGEKESVSVRRPPTQLSHQGEDKLVSEFGGENYFEKPETKKRVALFKEADELEGKGITAPKLMYDLESGAKHGLSDAEHVIMVRYADALATKLRATDPNSPEWDRLIKERNKVINTSSGSGTESARALGARNISIGGQDPETYENFINTDFDANKNAPFTDNQKKEVLEDFNKLKKDKEEFEKDRTAFEGEVAKFKAEQEAAKLQKSTKKSERKTHEERVAYRKSEIEKAREALKKLQPNQLSSTIPFTQQVRELIAIAPHVKNVLLDLLEEGALKLGDAIEKLHDEFKEFNVSKRNIHDIISGEYDNKKIITKTEAKVAMEDLRSQATLINKLEKLENGEEPKNEKAKRKRLQEITDLQKQIKEHGITQLSQLKKRNETETKKIKEIIDKGDFAPEEKRIPILQNKEYQKRFPQYFKDAQRSRDELNKTRHEIALRRLKWLYEHKSDKEKTFEVISKSLNIPRTLMTIGDFSAVFRQAAVATAAHPIIASKALKFMFEAAANEKIYSRWLDEVHNDPLWEEAEKSKLPITDPESLRAKEHEEAFYGAQYAEQIPLAGSVVKASERAYNGYLNFIRWEMFKMYANEFREQGKTYDNNPELYKGISSFIGSATGRGGMRFGESAAPVLNAILFASRLIAARVNMLGLTDIPNLVVRGVTLGYHGVDYGFYSKLPPAIRVKAMADMAKFVGVGILTLVLAKQLGANVELDPRSSDFGKIHDGDTRWDIWGGFQPYARLLAQIASGQSKSANTGKVYDLDGSKFGSRTVGDQIVTFGRGKLSPIFGTAADILTRRTLDQQTVDKNFDIPFYSGDNPPQGQITLTDELLKFITPLIINDVRDAWKSRGVSSLYTVLIPSLFGIGVQTYSQKQTKQSGSMDSRHTTHTQSHSKKIKKGDKKLFN